ncbi:MAG: hypothetical protein KAU22_04135 [Desulfuromonadales bacterium]|nr:hypothetical protein [Desulfuromonadales bacterium]
MEPIRFADILFVFLVLVITFSILWLVHKSRNKTDKTKVDDSSVVEEKDA